MKWKTIALGDLVTISKGKKHSETNDETSFRYLQIEDLNGQFTKKYTKEKGTYVNEKDIVIVWDGANAGKVGCGLTGVIGSTLARLTFKKDNIETRFVKRYLDYQFEFIKSQRTGATIPHVSGEALKRLPIPLPSFDTQQKIAAILDQADSLRQKAQQLLLKYDELLESIFYQMFGDPFLNPKKWVIAKLKDLVKQGDNITYGVVQPGDHFENGVPIIRVGDFDNMQINKMNLKKIAPSIEASYKRTRLLGDEILIACVGSIGKIALADSSLKGFNIVRATARVRLDEAKANRKYVAYHLNTSKIQNYFIKETRTVSQPTLNISHIEQTPILLPPMESQIRFSEFAEKINSQKETAIVQSTKSEFLFQSLLQQAFKGDLII